MAWEIALSGKWGLACPKQYGPFEPCGGCGEEESDSGSQGQGTTEE